MISYETLFTSPSYLPLVPYKFLDVFQGRPTSYTSFSSKNISTPTSLSVPTFLLLILELELGHRYLLVPSQSQFDGYQSIQSSQKGTHSTLRSFRSLFSEIYSGFQSRICFRPLLPCRPYFIIYLIPTRKLLYHNNNSHRKKRTVSEKLRGKIH